MSQSAAEIEIINPCVFETLSNVKYSVAATACRLTLTLRTPNTARSGRDARRAPAILGAAPAAGGGEVALLAGASAHCAPAEDLLVQLLHRELTGARNRRARRAQCGRWRRRTPLGRWGRAEPPQPGRAARCSHVHRWGCCAWLRCSAPWNAAAAPRVGALAPTCPRGHCACELQTPSG